jgi:hypothetical protein
MVMFCLWEMAIRIAEISLRQLPLAAELERGLHMRCLPLRKPRLNTFQATSLTETSLGYSRLRKFITSEQIYSLRKSCEFGRKKGKFVPVLN